MTVGKTVLFEGRDRGTLKVKSVYEKRDGVCEGAGAGVRKDLIF